MKILLISMQKVTNAILCNLTDPANSQYIIMVATFATIALIVGYLVFDFHKLDKYRRNVRPGNVVNFKSGNDIVFKIVKSRPAMDMVILSNMDDETILCRASIHKIYPL